MTVCPECHQRHRSKVAESDGGSLDAATPHSGGKAST